MATRRKASARRSTGKKKSTFGWKAGQKAGYTYRTAKSPQGTVRSVTPGTTRKTAKVSIQPAPGNNFKGGRITRHLDKIHHISKFSKAARTPLSAKRKAASRRK